MKRETRQREARRLRRSPKRGGEGLTVRAIAERLGVSVGTAHRDVNPKADERYRRAARERKRERSEDSDYLTS